MQQRQSLPAEAGIAVIGEQYCLIASILATASKL
jgi:hypothetical protein